MSALHEAVLAWFADHARDLPWRGPGVSAWSVLVSEVMLQQTPVARVQPAHEQWMERWPTPADLAAASSGEAVRMWGRLGYPRRALRLHAAAVAITETFDGEVPDSYDELIGLPGIGDYTASAVLSFAYGQRHAVLDTNVRRVLARAIGGVEFPPTTISKAERLRAADLLPEDPETAATWAVATMELGALVCTARDPRCDDCPIRDLCAWREDDYPGYDGPPRRGQAWTGTDRQCRGRIMAVLRDAEGAVHTTAIESAWPEPGQRARCLSSLVADGLVVATGPTTYALPG